jgi:predicted phosphodiesterase
MEKIVMMSNTHIPKNKNQISTKNQNTKYENILEVGNVIAGRELSDLKFLIDDFFGS